MAKNIATSCQTRNFCLSSDLSTTSSIKSNVSLKPIPNPPKVNVRSSFPPHSKGSVASSISHHSKNSNNVNQSAGARTNLHNTKVNKSKSNVSHNAKHPAPNNSNPHQGQVHKKGAKFGTKIQDGGGKVGNQSEANILRTSLTEDVPRRELATVAAPQE